MTTLLKQPNNIWSSIMRNISTNVSLKSGQKIYSNLLQATYLKNNTENKNSEYTSKKAGQHHYIKNSDKKTNATPLAVTQTYYLAITALVLILLFIS